MASVALTSVPESLDEAWRAPDTTPGNHTPSITGGVIIGADGDTLHGYSPAGDKLWTYERDVELCAMSPAFDAAIATYRTGEGGTIPEEYYSRTTSRLQNLVRRIA